MNNAPALHHYLSENRIIIKSSIKSRKKLLQEVARQLANSVAPGPDQTAESVEKDIYHCLLEREKLGNTGIGEGVAIPHSRCQHTDRALITVITLCDGIDYESLDRKPVDIVFGILVPTEATDEHLSILAAIAKTMSQADNRNDLSSVRSAVQAIELIESWG